MEVDSENMLKQIIRDLEQLRGWVAVAWFEQKELDDSIGRVSGQLMLLSATLSGLNDAVNRCHNASLPMEQVAFTFDNSQELTKDEADRALSEWRKWLEEDTKKWKKWRESTKEAGEIEGC